MKQPKQMTSEEGDRAIVNASEHEKRLLAHQLHEGLIQTLSAASILASVLALRSRPAALKDLAPESRQLQNTIDAAIDETRLLLRQLQPPDFEGAGLMRALQDLALLTSRKRACRFRCEARKLHPCGPAESLAVFRIAQEAVQDALCRSGVTLIRIGLRRSGAGRLTLVIQDDSPMRSGQATRSERARPAKLMERHARLVGAELRTERNKRGARLTCILAPAQLI
jgi:two-component system, NarL family, sensor kinase